jgi:CRISPR-associated protein Cmr2
MGPSLHAAISRMLVDFAHRVVPWVIEQEYGGRLVYSGGDDVLALLPATDALPAAQRLQELFSATWVLDGRPDLRFGEPFPVQAPEAWDPEKARARFALIAKGTTTVDLGRGELFPLLGPNQSLSAGIGVAHFKTPLGGVLKKAADMQEQAKRMPEKASIGLAAYSRGGVKVQATLRWRQAPSLGKAIQGFEEGALPGKLPYQLREQAQALLAVAATRADVSGLSTALLEAAGSGEWQTGPQAPAVRALWESGIEQALCALAVEDNNVTDLIVEQATAPLRLARTLAASEEGED